MLGDLRPTGTQQTVSMVTRLRVSDLARMALAWAISSLALIAADQLLPGMEAGSPWQLVAAAAGDRHLRHPGATGPLGGDAVSPALVRTMRSTDGAQRKEYLHDATT